MIKILIPSLINLIYIIIPSSSKLEQINIKKIRLLTIISSIIILGINFIYILKYNLSDLEYQFRSTFTFFIQNYNITIGIDSLNLILITLNNIIFPLMYIYKTEGVNLIEKKMYYKNLIGLQLIINILLLFLDLFIFYVMYELILIPMFILIILTGSKAKKIEASYKLFIFTIFGSLFLLFSIIYIYLYFCTFQYEILNYQLNNINFYVQSFLWFSFILSFLIKIPTFPFHMWLPFAHVQASTTSSVILASMLLKLGTYGILRFNNEFFKESQEYYSPIIIILALISIFNSIFITLRLIDLKMIVAYSSIIHMNLFLLGLYLNSSIALQGSIFSLISHGFISSLLFFNVGSLYNRFHSRIFLYFRGLSLSMPLFSTIFCLAILSNISIPLTSAFIGEYVIIYGVYLINKNLMYIIILSLIISSYYALWINNKILFGTTEANTLKFNDLTRSEFFISFFLLFLIFLFGLFPNLLFNFFYLFSL